MFRVLAHWICKRPLICIGVWVAIALLSGLIAPSEEQLQQSEPSSVLPEGSPLNRSMRFYAETFPDQTSRSRTVLVFHRSSGLGAADRQYLARLAPELKQAGQANLDPWRVWSPDLSPELGIRLNSSDGQAAMIVVGMDVNFLTQRAAGVVDRVEAIARQRLPEGLTLELTGDAAIGREHNARSAEALQRTTKVTIVAVLLILAFVYRSPLGALVPLVSIGCSVFVAFRLLDFLALAGWSISGAERTFTVVLLFGAGTNYALFWISRYREGLACGFDRTKAVTEAMLHVGPSMLGSAGTTAFGLMMLMAADMVIIHNSGKVLGLVLAISLLAAMTLTPAMIFVMGDAFFWPRTAGGHLSVGQRYIWPLLAKHVVRRPGVVFGCGLLLVGIPAVASFWTPMRYDSFGEIPEGTTPERGLELVEAHFDRGELFSTRFLLESPSFNSDASLARSASIELADRIAGVAGVTDVWHLGAPAGLRRGSALTALLNSPLVQAQVAGHYFADTRNVLQLEVMQQHPPMTPQAVAVFDEVRQLIEEWAGESLPTGHAIYAVGQTPYIKDVKQVADRDLSRVIWLVMGVIWLIVQIVIRDVRLTIFMIIATLISFATAFGLTGWLFVGLLGKPGVDYKVQILLFVIIVAVGQDYNIFMVRRMLEELKSYDIKEAMTRSIILTGPVISSCGMIMAATLGSLATTRVDITEQLGFACAVGVLIDTFLVRPLLIPSFYLLIGHRGGRHARAAVEKPEPPPSPLSR